MKAKKIGEDLFNIDFTYYDEFAEEIKVVPARMTREDLVDTIDLHESGELDDQNEGLQLIQVVVYTQTVDWVWNRNRHTWRSFKKHCTSVRP